MTNKYILSPDSECMLICPNCMTQNFTVTLTHTCIHLTCAECQEQYSIGNMALAHQPYDAADDAGFIIDVGIVQ
jgi:hypothetical protein